MNFKIIKIKKEWAEEPRLLIEYINDLKNINTSPDLYSLKMLNGLTSSLIDEIAKFCFDLKNARSNAKPLIHLMVSFCSSEYPSYLMVRNIVQKILQSIGVGEHLAFYKLHQDTENLHLHIALSRIDPISKKIIQIENGFIIKAIRRVVDRIAAIEGWRQENNSRTFISMDEVSVDKKSSILSKTTESINRMLFSAFENSTNWEEFKTYLLQIGPRISIDKKTNGNDELILIFNGAVFYEKEIPAQFSYQELKKYFGNYKELNHGFKPNKHSEFHDEYFGERKNNNLSPQLLACTNIRDRGACAGSFLHAHALINRIKNSIVRRESCSTAEQSRVIQKDLGFSSKICELFKRRKEISLIFRCGKNPDLFQFASSELSADFLMNFLRKVRLSKKPIDFYLGFDISTWLCFKINSDALAKLDELPFQIFVTQYLDDFYVAIGIKPVLLEFKNASYLAKKAIFGIIKDKISIDNNYQQEVGLPIYTKDQVEIVITKKRSYQHDADFVEKINRRIEEDVCKKNGVDRADIKTLLNEIRPKYTSWNVHFTRELFLFYYIGHQKFGNQLSRELIADAFMEVAKNHGYTRAEIDEMVINFSLVCNNEPKQKTSTALKKKKFTTNDLHEKCIKSFVNFDITEVKDVYWSALLHENHSGVEMNAHPEGMSLSISGENEQLYNMPYE
ncbi:relaxase/mobilization nuclease domain-containing protein [Deefgea rivuli]|uniref:relaxase/mobilization nuclease domain-containing protein n=1 Tax=Deefgea rivuli TaxID=400948 RepID=UPI0004873E45|nr:relaxase/mobilization nuclease domain-containing protein [Deefgea rivuli]